MIASSADRFLDWAKSLPLSRAAGWLLVMNLAAFALAFLLGSLVRTRFSSRPVSAPPDALEVREVVYTAVSIVLNWLVTVVAWWLWQTGAVVIGRRLGWPAWLEVPVLIVGMDLAMYALHRVVHLPPFYAIHRLHHDYERPRPLSLFVLHPLETLAFGLLWLAVLSVRAWSWLGMSVYLAINLSTGTLGHLGVEPFPGWFARIPLLRQVGTSTFHAEHHRRIDHNYGFYTLIWDRLFGTLSPGYDTSFGKAQPSPPDKAQPRG